MALLHSYSGRMFRTLKREHCLLTFQPIVFYPKCSVPSVNAHEIPSVNKIYHNRTFQPRKVKSWEKC